MYDYFTLKAEIAWMWIATIMAIGYVLYTVFCLKKKSMSEKLKKQMKIALIGCCIWACIGSFAAVSYTKNLENPEIVSFEGILEHSYGVTSSDPKYCFSDDGGNEYDFLKLHYGTMMEMIGEPLVEGERYIVHYEKGSNTIVDIEKANED